MLRYILHNYHKGNRPREFCCGSVVKALAYETGFLNCNPDLSSASRLAAKLFLGPIPTSSKSALRQYNSIDSDAATFILRQWKWNQDMIAAAVNQVNSNYWLGLEESLQLEFKVSFDKNAALCNEKKNNNNNMEDMTLLLLEKGWLGDEYIGLLDWQKALFWVQFCLCNVSCWDTVT